MNRLDFHMKKLNNEKITMITCYDYTSARIVSKTSIDCVLVGDSAAMTMHGYKDTVPATLEMMEFHTRAVARGLENKFLISDLPFLSYRKSLTHNVSAAQRLFQAGANAVKLESAAGNATLIRHLVESGIPVMGHLGLTMQLMHMLGGLKIQGRSEEAAQRLYDDALLLQEAGCFALVLECIPAQLAAGITKNLQIPTIGIGAGPHTDGQVLVFQDLLGLNIDFKPKFVKQYLNGSDLMQSSIENYISQVKSGGYPSDEHCYLA